MAADKEKNLVIVESPAKAKTISRFLGKDYRVEASYGHVRDLPQNAKEIPAAVRDQEWARLGVNVEEGFEPLYVVPADKKKHVKRLKEALVGANRLLLATDEDREGESISWHVLQLLKPPKHVSVERIVFHEVTPEAIAQALTAARSVDLDLVKAQEARRVLDRLFGYSLSPLLWKRVAPGLSAGRVQSVAVRLLVERERERIAFIPAEFWDLKAEVGTREGRFRVRLVRVGEARLADGKSFDARGKLGESKRLHLTAESAQELVRQAADTQPWQVTALERTPGQQRPAPPFTTSTLQQEGNRKLRMSSRQTMRVAQQLYEGIDLGGERVGLITYMRTDSLSLAERAVEQARKVIAAAYGKEYLPSAPIFYKTKAKRAQEAHEAIRPTDLARRPQDVQPFLDQDQFRLYELVWKRTIACQMLPASFERTAVEVSVHPAGRPALTFAATGRRIVFPGFLRAYVEGSDDPEAQLGDQETLLPAMELGQELALHSLEAEGHSTRSPYRYTEASLVKVLEEEGIGRPSTYATILSTIQDRGYVFKKGNELVPTFTAFCVTLLLEQQFRDLVETDFTARMEDELDDVAAGKLSWDTLVSSFYWGADQTPGLVTRLSQGEVSYPTVDLGKDPANGEEVVVKVGKYGPYLRRGEGGAENVVALPADLAPDELTLKLALDLLRNKGSERAPIAHEVASGRPITLQYGRFGEYLELELTEAEREDKVRPKRVSLPRGLKAADVTPEIARQLMQLPRVLGAHPDTGLELSTNIGRFGPFLKHGDEFRSLDSWQKACELELPAALALLREPKVARRQQRSAVTKSVLKDLGRLDGAAGVVQVLAGRYGPYVTDGEVNATVPKGTEPANLTAEEALALLAARRSSATKKRRGARR